MQMNNQICSNTSVAFFYIHCFVLVGNWLYADNCVKQLSVTVLALFS